MNKVVTHILKKGATFFFCGFTLLTHGQSKTDVQFQSVFDQLVLAYGSAKTAPQLIVIKSKQKQGIPAYYERDPIPTVKVDENLLDICRTFGKDSLNALSVVISHELAHYYNDHDFCTDFAYAIQKRNESFAQRVKLIDKNQKVIYETQADDKGLFYAAIAGYNPFEVQPKLLDEIYRNYQLYDEIGYPSKVERKEIASNGLIKARRLFNIFKSGLKYIEEKNYDGAIRAFMELNSDFPSRENYNNLGLARTLKALELKEPARNEKDYPKRFLYPLEIDNTSRLNQEITRDIEDDKHEHMTKLLKSAQKDFEMTISLDPKYFKGYVNLACVFDLLGNSNASIGKIKELPKEQQLAREAQRILAIALFHNNQKSEAITIWNVLKM